MLYIKIVILLTTAGLFFIGGWKWHNARRFIMPVVLAFTCLGLTYCYWSLTMLLSMAFLCIGYGDKSPLKHSLGNGWGRSCYGLLVALSLSLGLFYSGHLDWYWLAAYLAINFTLENALKDIPQWIGDTIIGCGFGSIVFLLK